MAFDMSKLLVPGRVALLLSEVQRSVVGDLAKRPELAQAARDAGVIPNSARLAAAARAHNAPVVHCLANTDPKRFGANTNARLFKGVVSRDEASPNDPAGDTPCPEVWRSGDILSPRDHGLSPMADSQLDRRLRNSGITTVILAGVSLNMALVHMAMEAVNSSYQVIIASDAVAGVPTDYAEPILKYCLSFIATITSTDELIAAWRNT
jgi:nicotinamidase-related amidase